MNKLHIVLFLCFMYITVSHEQEFRNRNNLIAQEDSGTTDSSGPTLPPLITYVDYGEECNPINILKTTVCKTYERTVACIGYGPLKSGTCQCNLLDDAEYHEQWDICVSKVGSLCFLNENALGRKVCVENADCFADQEGPGHNVGRCECLYGFIEDDAGHCIADPSISESDRSTVRPTTPFPTRAPAITGETPDSSSEIPSDDPTTPDTSGSDSRTSLLWTLSYIVIFISHILPHN